MKQYIVWAHRRHAAFQYFGGYFEDTIVIVLCRDKAKTVSEVDANEIIEKLSGPYKQWEKLEVN